MLWDLSKNYTALNITCQSLQGHQQLRSMAFAHVDANCVVVVVSTDSTGLHKQPGSHQDLPTELHVLMLIQDFLSISAEPTYMKK